MQYLLSIIYFLGILSILVIVHEWGHFIAAKWCGMRVDDFSLFFGKRLVCLGKRNGTEYNIRSIPFGGFVKIVGMEPDDISNGAPIFRPRTQKKRGIPKMLIGLNSAALEKVDFDQVSDSIIVAVEDATAKDSRLTSSGANYLESLLKEETLNPDERIYLEQVLETRAFVPDPRDYNQRPLWQRAITIFAGPFVSMLFGYLLFCVMGFTLGLPSKEQGNSIEYVVKGNPADKAGLKSGDSIVAVNGIETKTGKALVDIIHQHPEEPVTLSVVRGKEQITINATTRAEMVDGKKEGRLGFVPAIAWKRYGFAESVKEGTSILYMEIAGTLKAILMKPKQLKENVGGPIAIAGIIHSEGKQGMARLILLAAMLSVSIGLFNLFPIPILDGGHLLLLAIEGIRRRKLTTSEVYTAQLIGIGILGTLFMLVMYNDLRRLWA